MSSYIRKEGLIIDESIGPLSDELTRQVIEASGSELTLPNNKEWGVFEHNSGLARMPYSSLRSVHEEEEEAAKEAVRLNQQEGSIEFEITDDPESSVYLETYFLTGHVALRGVSASLVITARYCADVPSPAEGELS